MSTNSTEQLLTFISHNHLKKENGTICFDAAIHFYEPVAIDAVSEIQIISLPHEHALYVINYPDTAPQGGDVYSTARFIFSYENNEDLVIKEDDGRKILVVSLHKS